MERCWCCQSLLTTRGDCPICDLVGMMSPPHVCIKNGVIIGDEHDCTPNFQILEPDYETEIQSNSPILGDFNVHSD